MLLNLHIHTLFEPSPAGALATVWAVIHLVQAWALPQMFGTEQVGGTARWRSAASLVTQWIVLPVCWFSRSALGELVFVYVFALYLLLDVFIVKIESLLVVHHFFCLLGHSMVVLNTANMQLGFDIYFAGVVVLELGSGCMNLFCLYPKTVRTAVIYALGMSLSNATACHLCHRWMMLPISLVPKVLNLIVVLVMVTLRQFYAYKNMRRCIRRKLPIMP